MTDNVFYIYSNCLAWDRKKNSFPYHLIYQLQHLTFCGSRNIFLFPPPNFPRTLNATWAMLSTGLLRVFHSACVKNHQTNHFQLREVTFFDKSCTLLSLKTKKIELITLNMLDYIGFMYMYMYLFPILKAISFLSLSWKMFTLKRCFYFAPSSWKVVDRMNLFLNE